MDADFEKKEENIDKYNKRVEQLDKKAAEEKKDDDGGDDWFDNIKTVGTN